MSTVNTAGEENMSVIALKWAYSQPISNPVAKNVLAFLASHNFPSNKMFFAIETICRATAYSRTAVKAALNWLVANGYLKKEIRISEDGGQQTNVYVLNISDAYLEEFCSDYNKLSTPPGREATPNSNIINNNFNKRRDSTNDKKINNEPKQCAKFWEPGNPDYDRVNN